MTEEQYDGIIEAIKNQNNICEKYNLGNEVLDTTGYLNNNGQIVGANGNYNHTSDYIEITKGETYNIITNYNPYEINYCLYNEFKELLSCTSYQNNRNVIINNEDANYIRYSGNISSGARTTFTGKYCYNPVVKEYDKINDITNILVIGLGLVLVITLLLRRVKY